MDIAHRIARLRLARQAREPESVPSGHRSVPHTADLRIEAWGPTREDCLAEAIRGLVGSFADVSGLRPRTRLRQHLTAGSDEDLLVAVLDEVIYRLDADGRVPVRVDVLRATGAGVLLSFELAPVTAAEITGAAPKAVSLHELRCGPDGAGRWSCSVTVDV